jgi:hypothetical protein
MPKMAIVTPTALERVVKMVEQGVSSAEIANEIGCTLGTLRVRCSQSRISLRHVRFKRVEGDGRGVDSSNDHARRRLSLQLPPETAIQLEEWATDRGVSVASLVAKLLVAIAHDSLCAAVLDEPVPALGRS